jgi:IMP cyclohydrolase
MAYFGRVVAAGLTRNGEAAVIYGISGRSEGSKKRKLVVEIDNYDSCIHVRPVGELTPDQKARYDIFFYPAIVAADTAIAVVTNGDHTRDVLNFKLPFENSLRGRVHEPDDYSTPRIAAEIHKAEGNYVVKAALLASEARSFMEVDRLVPELFVCLSTYQGKGDEPEKPEKGRIWHRKFDGATADDLAQELYDWFDFDKRVATGAAVLNKNSREWQLAVRNLHE